MIYLDNAATTYPKPEFVYTKMDWVNRNLSINAGRGAYKVARKATSIIDECKENILNLTGASVQYTVSLMDSITTALNQAIQGIDYSTCKRIYVTPYEHNAVGRTVNLIKKKYPDVEIELLPLREDLTIDIDQTIYNFAQNPPGLVIVNMLSNVTGYILPYAEIFEEAKKHDAITILDSAQGLGVLEIDLSEVKCDILAFAGHKSLYGPFGIGGIVVKNNLALSSFIVGGNGSDSLNLDISEKNGRRYEFSSPNVVAIAGLNESLKTINPEDIYRHEMELTTYLIDELANIENVNVYKYAQGQQIAVVSITIDGYLSSDIGMILDEDYDICVRTGYHCAPFIHKHLKDKYSNGTVRISIGRYTEQSDVDALVLALKEISAE